MIQKEKSKENGSLYLDDNFFALVCAFALHKKYYINTPT